MLGRRSEVGGVIARGGSFETVREESPGFTGQDGR